MQKTTRDFGGGDCLFETWFYVQLLICCLQLLICCLQLLICCLLGRIATDTVLPKVTCPSSWKRMLAKKHFYFLVEGPRFTLLTIGCV